MHRLCRVLCLDNVKLRIVYKVLAGDGNYSLEFSKRKKFWMLLWELDTLRSALLFYSGCKVPFLIGKILVACYNYKKGREYEKRNIFFGILISFGVLVFLGYRTEVWNDMSTFVIKYVDYVKSDIERQAKLFVNITKTSICINSHT